MDVHVRDLRYFVAVAEELSFTRAAAERLFISQPALSKQIRLLEASLRVPLFDRDRRTVRLTEAGEALLPRARRLIADWDSAQVAITDAARCHVLTVGFQTRIGRGLIPAVTSTMGVRLPDWRLRFRQVGWSDPTAGLATGRVDVAVAWLPVPDTADLSWKVVATEDRWVAMTPSHRLADQESVPCGELVGESFVAPPAAGGALRDFWLGNDHRSTPATVVAEAETAEEMLEAVAAGVGVALLPAGNARIDRRDDVITRPVTGLSPGRLAVIWRTDDHREAVRVFAESCERCLCPEAA
jgi:DNA-binding transcriptional LysR family regulator